MILYMTHYHTVENTTILMDDHSKLTTSKIHYHSQGNFVALPIAFSARPTTPAAALKSTSTTITAASSFVAVN